MTGARRISIFCSHFMKVIVQITPFDKLPRHLDSMFFETEGPNRSVAAGTWQTLHWVQFMSRHEIITTPENERSFALSFFLFSLLQLGHVIRIRLFYNYPSFAKSQNFFPSLLKFKWIWERCFWQFFVKQHKCEISKW